MWEYLVKDEYLTQFRKVYAADGTWTQLFRTMPGYLKTELIQDCDRQHRFITIDYWESRCDFLNMRHKIGAEYRDLDIRTEDYTESERHLGYFENT